METLKHLTGQGSGEQLTFLPEDSRASHSLTRDFNKEQKITVTSGQRCLESLERFARVSLWQKTFMACLIGRRAWYSRGCRLTWKVKATKFSRLYCQLAVSMRRIKEIEFGLLPTLTANTAPYQYSNGDKTRPVTLTLVGLAQRGLIPTLNANDAKNNGKREHSSQIQLCQILGGAINPEWAEEFMGYPIGWTELKDSETP